MKMPLFRGLLILFFGFALATQLGNGCVTTGGGGGGRPGDGWDNRPPGGGWGDRIPSRARLVEEGRGIIRYRAPEDGQVWLQERDRRVTIADFRIRRGREFIVSPKDNRAWIDDERVLNYDFDRDRVHRIYYLSDRDGGSGGGWDGGGSGRPPPLPPELRDADRVAFGRGDLSYSARNDGRAWVYDVTDGRIVYSSELRRGERLRVSPRENYIGIGERSGARASYSLDPRRDYAIYYQAGRGAGGSGSGAGTPSLPFPSGEGAAVPKSSSIVREGRGDLSFVADGTGTVYIYDVKAKKTLATYRLKKGQRFTVSPEASQAAVDGRGVFQIKLNPNATYRLYYNLDV